MGIRRWAGSINIPAISAALQPPVEAWMNAVIQLINPDINGGTFDRTTNSKTRSPAVLWEGPARIQALRWPTVATSRQAAESLREVAFHIPIDSDIPPLYVPQGYRVRVLDGGMSPQFTGGLFVVTTAFNSSYDWDRRIEATMDQGQVITWE